MTAATTSFTRLRCDATGCAREFPDNGPLQGGAAFTRSRAANAGWTQLRALSEYRLEGDLCPEHAGAAVDDLNLTGRLTG